MGCGLWRVADLGIQRQRIASADTPEGRARMNDDTHPRIRRRRDLANSLHIPAELATPDGGDHPGGDPELSDFSPTIIIPVI
jgi:hypothetical protein